MSPTESPTGPSPRSSTGFRRGLGSGLLVAALGIGALMTAGSLVASAQGDGDPGVEAPAETPESGERVRPDHGKGPGGHHGKGPGGHHRRGPGPLMDPEKAEAFRTCMAEQGFELPAIERDEDGRPVRPPVRPPGRPEISDEEREAFRAAARECGKSAGCELPPPPDGAPEATPEETPGS
jgi:hypothetical protein